jgi:hypothetical protein
MSKADRLKEEIGWLKVVFALLVATDISLVAWVARSYARTGGLLIALGVLAITAITGAAIWVNRMAYAKIDQLEDL